eukprot:1412137-Lingulodinium_polyedra.AAC.1
MPKLAATRHLHERAARTLQSANRRAIDAQILACATAETGMASVLFHVGCAFYIGSQTGCV